MSVAANAESVLTYSFTDYIPFNVTTPTVKDHQRTNKDSWRLSFNNGGYYDSSVSLSLTARNGGDCSFSVKLSVLDGDRQSKLDLVQKGWKYVGSSQAFVIPKQVVSGLQNAHANQIALQVTVTKIVKPSVAEEMSTLFKSESFGDVEIECADGVKFRCHKDMLTAKSLVFATMFNLEMKESVENRVRIEDFSSDVISALLRFCYLGDWGDISGVADRLYVAADRYQLDLLKMVAGAELNLNLNANSITSTYRLAQLYKDRSLVDGCVEYLASHKGDLSAMEVLAEATKNE